MAGHPALSSYLRAQRVILGKIWSVWTAAGLCCSCLGRQRWMRIISLQWNGRKEEYMIQILIQYYFGFVSVMSRYTEKRPTYKPRGEETKGKFGFEYNEEHINYRTEIPPLPEKFRHRPDEKIRDKKIEDVNEKIKTLKEERRAKKDSIKKLNKGFDDEINDLKKKVELGRKCLTILLDDVEFLDKEISKTNSRLHKTINIGEDFNKTIRDLKHHSKPARRVYKPLEEMTVAELEGEIRKIEYDMSTRDLSKKEESELSQQINKINRMKLDNTRKITEPEVSEPTNNEERLAKLEADLAANTQAINKIKTERSKLFSTKDQYNWKIECIKEDINIFIEEIKEIAEKEANNEDAKQLTEESKVLKDQIYKLREQVTRIEKEHDDKLNEYNYEQEKIKWIGWATKVQDRKREEWEVEKAEKKRLKLKEKAAGGEKKDDKKDKPTEKGEQKAEGTQEERKPEERKKINRNQKEIDICAFLVDYCKGLYPGSNNAQTAASKKDVNIEAELKKGAWAKEKGVQIIQSKKAKKDEEEAPKTHKRREQQKEEEIVATNRFSHTFNVANSFDAVKIIPPTSPEELDKIIKELEDKLEYYLLHPDEGVEHKFAQDKKYVDKNIGSTTDKSAKSRGPKAKVINSEDFPSLA